MSLLSLDLLSLLPTKVIETQQIHCWELPCGTLFGFVLPTHEAYDKSVRSFQMVSSSSRRRSLSIKNSCLAQHVFRKTASNYSPFRLCQKPSGCKSLACRKLSARSFLESNFNPRIYLLRGYVHKTMMMYHMSI